MVKRNRLGKNNKESLSDLWNYNKRSNICVIGILGEEKSTGLKTTWKNVLRNLKFSKRLTIYSRKWANPNIRINVKKLTPSLIINKLQKTKDKKQKNKQKNLRAATPYLHRKNNSNDIISSGSKERNKIFQVQKKRTVNPESYIQWNYPLGKKGK